MTGYDELSTLIGSYPELAMFRRFGPLSAKVLLCMQAELLDLEDDLNIISEIDFKDWESREILTSWAKANAATSENGADLRRRKVKEAQEKLERYCQSRSSSTAHMDTNGRRHSRCIRSPVYQGSKP
jgi:hypothetical protein